jgi:hypothetical protein
MGNKPQKSCKNLAFGGFTANYQHRASSQLKLSGFVSLYPNYSLYYNYTPEAAHIYRGSISTAARFHRSLVGALQEIVVVVPAAGIGAVTYWTQKVSPAGARYSLCFV